MVAVVAMAGACGGSSTPKTTAAWTKAHGKAVTQVSSDVNDANSALDKGQRPDVLSACHQLQDDLAAARKPLPVPDATANGVVTGAFDAVNTAVTDCLSAAQVGNDARLTEQSQAEMKVARTKMDDANHALSLS